jgi:hypothetical protein
MKLAIIAPSAPASLPRNPIDVLVNNCQSLGLGRVLEPTVNMVIARIVDRNFRLQPRQRDRKKLDYRASDAAK